PRLAEVLVPGLQLDEVLRAGVHESRALPAHMNLGLARLPKVRIISTSLPIPRRHRSCPNRSVPKDARQEGTRRYLPVRPVPRSPGGDGRGRGLPRHFLGFHFPRGVSRRTLASPRPPGRLLDRSRSQPPTP